MAREIQKLPPLTDDSPMPSGKYKDKKMEEVPAKYLLYIYDNMDSLNNERIKKYIEDNIDVLYKQAMEE